MSELLIGVDVGGTKIAAGVVTTQGVLLESVVQPTPAIQGPVAVLDAIAQVVTSLLSGDAVRGVGIGTGGAVDRQRGVVVAANELLPGWSGVDIRAELGRRLPLPIVADNDVNVFALAEQYFGAGTSRSDVLYASVGTGIGGGIVAGGTLLRGAHSTAGEFGHIAVPEAEGYRCNCGRSGHLEAVASGPAMTRRYREYNPAAEVTGLRDVLQRALARERTALRVLREGAVAMGRAMGGLVNIIDPELVVLGGGVADIGVEYWEPLRSAFEAELLPGVSGVTVEPAVLGSRAAVVGAAALHLEPDVSEGIGR